MMTTGDRDAVGSEILLFPCNGNAVEAVDCLADDVRPLGFVDDDAGKVGSVVLGLPVWDRAALARLSAAKVLAVPGSPRSFACRAEVIAGLGIPRARYATVIHPDARVSRRARIGANVLVMAGVVVTSNAEVGDHVIVLPNAVIHHDSRIGDWTIVGSGVLVAGSVDVGAQCYLGSGSCLRDNVRVAGHTLVGMGSTVLRSIDAPGGTWVGSPARLIEASQGDSRQPRRRCGDGHHPST